jgi:hypothetical protein
MAGRQRVSFVHFSMLLFLVLFGPPSPQEKEHEELNDQHSSFANASDDRLALS